MEMTTPTKSAAGRVQDAALTERILDAADAALRTTGLADFRIGHLATTVGCGKTAIYRRWSSKEELAAAVILRDSAVGEEPDTGSIVDDLVVHQEQNMFYQAGEDGQRNPSLLWGMLTEPEVRRIIDAQLMVFRRERGRTIVARGISRGELPPETDTDALLDMIAGFAFYRGAVRGKSLAPDVYRQIALSVTGTPPLRTDTAAYAAQQRTVVT